MIIEKINETGILECVKETIEGKVEYLQCNKILALLKENLNYIPCCLIPND
jgi:hypothetical protein